MAAGCPKLDEQRPMTRAAIVPPTASELRAARLQYRVVEPRDLFYRAATDLVDRARMHIDSPLSLAEALAVLLFTWNRAYYQYHPARPEHVSQIERLLERHGSALAEWRRSTLQELATEDEARIL